MSAQSRVPAGIPTGGRFATSERSEPAVALLNPPVEVLDENSVFDAIADADLADGVAHLAYPQGGAVVHNTTFADGSGVYEVALMSGGSFSAPYGSVDDRAQARWMVAERVTVDAGVAEPDLLVRDHADGDHAGQESYFATACGCQPCARHLDQGSEKEAA